MPLDSAIVGEQIEAISHTVDARWIMAYAAALADHNPRYFHTHKHPVSAHPLFPVCLEWPVILNIRSLAGSQSLSASEAARGVHASHDLHILRPIQADDVLFTSATMVEVKTIKPGAAYTMRLDTCDETGALVARTYQTGIYRGVEVTGGNRTHREVPVLPAWLDPTLPQQALTHTTEATQRATGSPDVSTQKELTIPVSAGLAHTYTECARIWNPIHTDSRVAREAGLPDIILHGTATLALAISAIVNTHAGGEPHRVTRLGGRFAAMVMMPSAITLHTVAQWDAQANQSVVSFAVKTQQGEPAISGGFVALAPAGG